MTVFVFWLLLGGLTFCSWLCPYHLVAEWAEALHVKLAEKKLDYLPAFDGLVAANGKLYLATECGSILCYEGK